MNSFKMFINRRAAKIKRKMNNSKINWLRKIRSTKFLKDPTIKSGTWLKPFGPIKLKCDSSQNTEEIRTTEAHFIYSDSIIKSEVQRTEK
jgi:hypothetical protein